MQVRKLLILVLTALPLSPAAVAGDGPLPDQVIYPGGNATGEFGRSVDASEQFLVIGAPGHADEAGGFEIHTLKNDTWVLEMTSVPSDYNAGDQAGFAVAITDKGNALIGVPGRGGGLVESWTRHPDLGWIKDGELPAPFGSRFGASIDMHGTVAVIGAPQDEGAFFVYQLVGGGEPWSLLFSETLEGSVPGSRFGHAVAIENEWIFVTAPGHYGGRAIAYRHVNGELTVFQQISDQLPWQDGRIGQAIVVSNGLVIISSPETPVADSVGAVWGMRLIEDDKSEDAYELIFYAGAPAGEGMVDYGHGLGLHGDRLMVGAPGYDGGAGLVEVYQVIGGDKVPSSLQELGLVWGDTGSRFGSALAANYPGFAVGAPLDGGGIGKVEYYLRFESEDAPPTSVPVQAAVTHDFGNGPKPMDVDVDGPIAVLGYPDADEGAGRIGLLQVDGGVWSQVQTAQGDPGEQLGASVAVCEGWVAGGCPGSNFSTGQVRLWTIDGNLNLDPHSTLAPFEHVNAHTGFDVDLYRASAGDVYLVVGAPGVTTVGDDIVAPGAVAVYGISPGDETWTELYSALSPLNGQHGTGYAVAISEDPGMGVYALVGAPFWDYDNPVAAQSGIVHVLTGSSEDGSWSIHSGITAAEFGGRLGASLDADGGQIILGQPGETPTYPNGAAQVRSLTGGDGSEQMLSPTEGSNQSWGFGSAVAIDVEGTVSWAAAGVPGFMGMRSPDSGAVEVYTRDCPPESACGAWVIHARVQPLDAGDLESLGGRITMSSGRLLFTNSPGGNHAPPAIMAAAEMTWGSAWLNEAGGSILNADNWSIMPDTGSMCTFSLLDSDPYPVFLYADVDDYEIPPAHLRVAFDAPLFVLPDEDAEIEMLSAAIGSSPTIRAATAMVDNGTLMFSEDVMVGDAQSGDAGQLFINQTGQTRIDGAYVQETTGAFNAAIGLNTPTDTSFLEAGSIELSGSLQVWITLETASEIDVGFRKVLANSVLVPEEGDDRFDVVILPGLPDGKAFELSYGAPPEGRGAAVWEVAVEVVSLAGLLGFDDPNSVSVTGSPIALEIVDLTGDGAEEICVIFDGEPGHLVIFENDGAGGIAQQIVLSTGDGPTALASGDWDGDGRNDLAVGHPSAEVLVLLNDDNDLTDGFVNQALTAIGPVTCLAPVNMNFDAPADLMAGIDDTDADGQGHWQWWLGQTALRGGGLGGGGDVDTPGVPVVLDPSENETQKDYMGVGLLRNGQAVQLKGLGALGLGQSLFVVGADPRDLELADLDGDGQPDIAATSAANGTVALLPGIGPPDGFEDAVFVPFGTTPTGLAAHDLNDDGMVDLAAITTSATGDRVVRVLQNDGDLSFTSVDTAEGESPLLLALGDVDGDGAEQLITIGSTSSLVGEGAMISLRDVSTETCPGDTDGNSTVNIEDLLNVIAQYGNDCEAGDECTADCDDNGVINIEDLLIVIAEFGDCGS